MQATKDLTGKETEIWQGVTFTLHDEAFVFDISKVREIIRMGVITKVPKSPDFIVGVLNLRGNIIPVIDLKKRFGWARSPYSASTRIIVVEVGAIIAGIIVDSVLETRQIVWANVEAAPATVMGGLENEYILGVAKHDDRLLVLLDIEKILVHKVN